MTPSESSTDTENSTTATATASNPNLHQFKSPRLQKLQQTKELGEEADKKKADEEAKRMAATKKTAGGKKPKAKASDKQNATKKTATLNDARRKAASDAANAKASPPKVSEEDKASTPVVAARKATASAVTPQELELAQLREQNLALMSALKKDKTIDEDKLNDSLKSLTVATTQRVVPRMRIYIQTNEELFEACKEVFIHLPIDPKMSRAQFITDLMKTVQNTANDRRSYLQQQAKSRAEGKKFCVCWFEILGNVTHHFAYLI